MNAQSKKITMQLDELNQDFSKNNLENFNPKVRVSSRRKTTNADISLQNMDHLQKSSFAVSKYDDMVRKHGIRSKGSPSLFSNGNFVLDKTTADDIEPSAWQHHPPYHAAHRKRKSKVKKQPSYFSRQPIPDLTQGSQFLTSTQYQSRDEEM